ncbi:MAG TPA: hypothetical protein VMW04_03990 [Patescibacteria group bacterium]|nr:hypothetical protein [Patescibacteria group bacterium]
MPKSKRFGVIDIGTLKVKMEVVELSLHHQIQTLLQTNTLTELGTRMNENNNKPLPQNLKNTIDELKRCKKVFEDEGVDKWRVVSTHALREMKEEGLKVAKTIKEDVGLTVDIISQQEEAEFFFSAVMHDFKTNDDFAVIDSGGGSVQILIGNKNQLKHSFLLKLGAQYLHDNFSPRHTGNDFPTKEEIEQMKKYILQQLMPIPKKLKTPLICGSSCVIDVFKTLGFTLKPFPFSPSHPYEAPVEQLKKFTKEITPVPYDVREKRFNFKQKYYMWGIDKALLVVTHLCDRLKAPFVIPSNANINQGLILSLVNQ